MQPIEMKERFDRLSPILAKGAIYVLLVMGAVVFLAPFAWMLSTSLKPLNEALETPIRWIPRHWEWNNYPDAIAELTPFWVYVGNTLLICVLNVIGTVVSSALAAYGFARIEWPGREKVFVLVLATMMIPFPVTMVPIYDLYRGLGWIGSFKPLWVGSFLASAFNVFLLRQFFKTIPRQLSEAARIDGCNEFQIFYRIILPLSKPSLLAVALFQFIYSWNDFLGPLIYLTHQRQFTLALALQSFQSRNDGTSWSLLMAASTLVVLPVIVLFFFTQRSFIQGIATTGSKD